MKKLLAGLLCFLGLLAFAACQTTTTTTATTQSTTATTSTTSATESSTTTVSHTPVSITYSAWNLGTPDSINLERLMLDAFEVQYPWISVDVIERAKVPDSSGTTEIDQNWNEFLGARAASGQLPDVYFTDSTETTIMNNWTRDVTALAEADPEFMNVAADIRNAANYGGKIMALPYAVYYFGYFINKTIFDDNNADAPLFEDDWETFTEKIKAVAKQNVTNGTGIAGLLGTDRILEWYPSQLNAELGWYTYDGELLHLDGPEFETALDLYQTLMLDKTFVYDALTSEEKTAAFETTDAWGTSKLAAYWEGSYILGQMLDYTELEVGGFDVDFIGTPGVGSTHKIPVILDLMCVSSQTQHPAEAYLLAKWMSFGRDGYLKRIELSTTVEGVNALNMTPLQPDEDLLDAFFAIYPTFTEFRKVVSHDSFIIEPNKYVPGYIKARWTLAFDATYNVGQIFDQVRAGGMNYADVKTEWNNKANGVLSSAREDVFTKLGVN